MREFQERRRFKKFLHSRYAIAALFILCVVLVRGVWSVYGKYERSKDIAERAGSELTALQVREQALVESIEDLDTELGREKEIRDRFGAVKDGERMIVLVDDESGAPATLPLTPESWWSRFLGLFKWN